MKFSDFLIKFAFLLDGSERYRKTKLFFKNFLENENSIYKKYFDYFMVLLIISSVTILIIEVRTPLSKLLYDYDAYFVTSIFIIEYISRMWVYNDSHKIVIEEFEASAYLEKKFDTTRVLKEIFKKKLEYIISPLAIIDFLAIIPSYRELRILRIFLLFRVFKLIRYSNSITQFFKVLASKKIELYALFLVAIFVILVSGISMYVFEEKENSHISSLFDAFYWSFVTLSSLGYGDITPVTDEGRAITFIVIITGIALVAFTTSVIVSAFNENIDEIKKDRVLHKINSLDSFYIICGYTYLTGLLAEKLKREKENFLIIDADEEKVNLALSKDYLSLRADASQQDTFKDIDFSKVKACLVLTEKDIHNIYICLNIRSFDNDVFLISLASDKNANKKLKLAGANYLISPYEGSRIFSTMIVKEPYALKAINDILMANKNAFCDQVEVFSNSFLENKTLKELNIEQYKIVLLGVSRFVEIGLFEKKAKRKFFFNPDDDFLIQKGDILIIIGYSISIKYFKNLITKSGIENV